MSTKLQGSLSKNALILDVYKNTSISLNTYQTFTEHKNRSAHFMLISKALVKVAKLKLLQDEQSAILPWVSGCR
jgi:hypothetical protein